MLASHHTQVAFLFKIHIFLGKEGAYQVIMDIMLKNEANVQLIKDCLKTLVALMTKQPDLLDDKGIQTMINFLDKQKDSEVQRLILKWIKECCVMHELNRYAKVLNFYSSINL